MEEEQLELEQGEPDVLDLTVVKKLQKRL